MAARIPAGCRELYAAMPQYDQFFKELLWLALYRFLGIFAPELAAHLDHSHPPEFLDKEFPAEVRPHVVDILARVRLAHSSQPRLIHVEAQGQAERELSWRMYDYHHGVRRRHRDVPIHSIAVLLHRVRRPARVGRYEEERDGAVYLSFEYGIIPLANLEARDFVGSGEALAHGLMGFFRRRGMDAAKLKADSLLNVLRLTEDEPALRQLLLSALERYFVLTAAQQARFHRLVRGPGYEEVRSMQTLTEVRAWQAALLRQMRAKFGDVPPEAEAAVRALDSSDEIEPYLDRVLQVARLEEMGFPKNGQQASSAQ